MIEVVANLEPLMGEVYLENELIFFWMGTISTRIDHHTNDDHLKSSDLFLKKSDLSNLILY